MKIFFFVLLACLVVGCYYDRESILYPEAPCNLTITATYNAVVLPLIAAQCNSCHAGSFASAGIRLDSYAETKKYVDNSKLMGSIAHGPGFSPMPKGGSSLASCDIAKIQAWITAGALNN